MVETKKYSFEKLDVYRKSREFNFMIFQLSETFPQGKDIALKIQMTRSSMSICANIAEGTGRRIGKDQGQFYKIAYASLMETLNHLLIASDYGFISEEKIDELYRPKIDLINAQLSALYRYSINGSNGIPK